MRGIFTLLWIHSVLGQDFSKCGRTTLKKIPFTEGTVAGKEHPHMCTISLAHGDFNVFAGAGSLISPNMVLSLASGVSKFRGGAVDKAGEPVSNLIDFRSSSLNSGSCDKDGGNLTVVCGDVNLHNPGPGRQSRRVSNILIHPGFDPKTLINDFAVLVVEQPFELTEYVGAVCLPDPGDSTEKVKSCVGLGHGNSATDYASYTSELQRTRILPLKSPQDCEKALNENYFTPNHSITWTAHPSHLCAGGEENSDTCEGDGGGPLVCVANPEVEEITAGEGGAGAVDNEGEAGTVDNEGEAGTVDNEGEGGTVDNSDCDDPIFGCEENEYPDTGEADEVFEGVDYTDEDLFGDYDPCDDTDDALDLRGNEKCKKSAGDSPGESEDNDNDVLNLRTGEKKKRSAEPQSGDLFGGDYPDQSDDVFEYPEYPDEADNANIFGDPQYPDTEGNAGIVGNRFDEFDEIRLVQLGVVAWGIGCGRQGFPSVYSSVASARCWLDQVMSCYKPSAGTSDSVRNLIDFRSAPVSPASVGGYSEEQCGAWLQRVEADQAACGCKQKLTQIEKSTDYYPDYDPCSDPDDTLGLRTDELCGGSPGQSVENDNNDPLELRSATLDLRRKRRKTGE